MPIRIELPSGRSIVLDQGSITLGTDPNCDVVLPDREGLHPRHARIRRVANRWMIEAEGDWCLQVGDGVAGHKCWLESGNVRLNEGGYQIAVSVCVGESGPTSSSDSSAGEALPTSENITSAAAISHSAEMRGADHAFAQTVSGDVAEWYYAVNGNRQGPVNAEKLRQLRDSGQLQATDLVWRVRAGTVRGLFQQIGVSDSPPPLPADLRSDRLGTVSPVPMAPISSPSPRVDSLNLADSADDAESVPSDHSQNDTSGKSRQPESKDSLLDRAKTAAKLVARQAERTKLLKVDLPEAYGALGKHIHSAGLHRLDLPSLFTEIDEALKKAASAGHGPDGPSESGAAAGKKKDFFTAAKDSAHAKALRMQIQPLYKRLGEECFDRFGTQCEASELLAAVQGVRARLAALDGEIAMLSQAQPGQLLTPTRIAVSGSFALATCAVLFCLGLMGTLRPSPYSEGFNAGRESGAKLVEKAWQHGQPAEVYIEFAPSVGEMRASGVEIPYEHNPQKQEQWEQGYSDGLKASLKK